ncbi:hypothetical protein ACFPJ1_40525 [Kribbella qitaiheensis]|uniref:hypothetical protein n=1 Tax=Kribbella qitaiheensis TaxID=1544730 RepID=UPI00360AFA93
MTTTTLSATQKNLLKIMQFREAPPGGPCWVVDAARGRYALWVMTMMGRYERHSHVNGRTLRTLHTAGLIEYGEDVKMPNWHRPDRLEGSWGSTVTLTEAGLAAIGDVA